MKGKFGDIFDGRFGERFGKRFWKKTKYATRML
jgi:hypothetical protein